MNRMDLNKAEYNILYRLIKDEIQKGERNGKVFTIKKFTTLYALQKKILLEYQRNTK